MNLNSPNSTEILNLRKQFVDLMRNRLISLPPSDSGLKPFPLNNPALATPGNISGVYPHSTIGNILVISGNFLEYVFPQFRIILKETIVEPLKQNPTLGSPEVLRLSNHGLSDSTFAQYGSS